MKKIISYTLLLFLCIQINAQKTFNERKKIQGVSNEKPNVPHTVTAYTGSTFVANPVWLLKTQSGKLISANLQPGGGENYWWVELVSGSNPQATSVAPPEELIYTETLQAFLNAMHAPQNIQFIKLQFSKDEFGKIHAKYQITCDKIPVYGSEVWLHGTAQEVQSINGLFQYPTASFSGNFLLDASNVKNKTREAFNLKSISDSIVVIGSYKMLAYHAEKIIYYHQNTPKACYQVEIHPDLIHRNFLILDASTGEILQNLNATCDANGPKTAVANDLKGNPTSINTYEYNSSFYLMDGSRSMFKLGSSSMPDDPVGAIWTLSANNTDASGSLYHISNATNSGWNATAVSAHNNAQKCYEYYSTVHGRNSIDGNGGTILSVINVTESSGAGMDNAYWNGSFMAYGNGKTVFKPLAGGLDVGGHEMTHGVVEKTANLEYQGQSGAINESMADIFGAMIDNDDWRMGEDVVKTTYFPSGALRDLSDPHNGVSKSQNGWQPRTMSEYITGSADNGGVHTNSGIPNWAYYKFATSITKAKAEKVYYRALSMYLTKTSQFLDLRFAVIKAAGDLYGTSGSEVAAAKAAFDAVEIYDPNPSTGGTGGGSTGAGGTFDLPANTGTEKILSYDTDNATVSTLYISSTVPNNYVSLSQTDFNRKPSVTDNGIGVYFTDVNGNLNALGSDKSFSETTINNQGIWSNCAISKDGRFLAAITSVSDTSIWIYNYSLKLWKRFKLYNPTYSGVNSSGVYEIDALEFDASGENLIYDAANKTKLSSGATLDYWDIGIIKVWDNWNNTWGNGKVQKLFNQLPEDISIGNPTYARNSPYIVAFDYIDVANNINAATGMNISTNKTAVIAIADKLTYPAYSRLDDKLLFDDYSATTSEPILKIIDLNSDKITAISSSEMEFIGQAKWGHWITYGTRRLQNNEKNILSFSFPSLNPAVQGVINGNNITLTVPQGTDVSNLIPTFINSPASIVTIANVEQVSGTTPVNFTTVKVYRVTAQDLTTKDYNVIVNFSNANTQNVYKEIAIYPTPASNFVEIPTVAESIVITDLLGKNLAVKFEITNNKTILNLKDFSNGIYILNVKSKAGNFSNKLVIEK